MTIGHSVSSFPVPPGEIHETESPGCDSARTPEACDSDAVAPATPQPRGNP